MYYHWYFKVALLLCSDNCKIYIYRTAIHISKRCNSCNQSISISVVKLLTLYLQKFLLMIYCHHCNRLDQSCATKWISSDIFQVQPLTYNIFHTYLSNTYAVLLWHSQSIKSITIDIFPSLLLIFSYYCNYYVTVIFIKCIKWYILGAIADICTILQMIA